MSVFARIFALPLVEVGSGLAGKFLEREIVHHQEIGTEEASQLAVEGVVGTGAGQGFQEPVGAAEPLVGAGTI